MKGRPAGSNVGHRPVVGLSSGAPASEEKEAGILSVDLNRLTVVLVFVVNVVTVT